mmetsp:Transcript_96842/g.257352  ORF Transcript_96842/g.257352 Transcript_96842/m.257352 type:complete len:314 (+) Transcript_96842:209-1150(+)
MAPNSAPPAGHRPGERKSSAPSPMRASRARASWRAIHRPPRPRHSIGIRGGPWQLARWIDLAPQDVRQKGGHNGRVHQGAVRNGGAVAVLARALAGAAQARRAPEDVEAGTVADSLPHGDRVVRVAPIPVVLVRVEVLRACRDLVLALAAVKCTARALVEHVQGQRVAQVCPQRCRISVPPICARLLGTEVGIGPLECAVGGDVRSLLATSGVPLVAAYTADLQKACAEVCNAREAQAALRPRVEPRDIVPDFGTRRVVVRDADHAFHALPRCCDGRRSWSPITKRHGRWHVAAGSRRHVRSAREREDGRVSW